MKHLILLLFSFSLMNAQVYDTILNTSVYKSYYSKKLKEPRFVVYDLYKGGGDCKRETMSFKNDTKLDMADSEYTGSAYDKGHIANAEDFAFNCHKEELTFRYYNCLPQAPNMNRGTWKLWETKIRKISQDEHLRIVAGGIWSNKTHNGMLIPDKCWKVVYSTYDCKILYVLVFTNYNKLLNENEDNTIEQITIEQLEKTLGYKIQQYLE